LWYGPLHERTTTALANFGYGLPDCRVWRYWDNNQPVQVTGATVKILVLARAGQTMLVIVSYGPGGEIQINPNRKVLGLSDEAVAVNVETGERLEQVLPGQFKLNPPRHDFRMIQIGKSVP
jgi:hypothetical protein